MTLSIAAAERGWLPDWVVQAGIRRLLRQRLDTLRAVAPDGDVAARARLVSAMRAAPIALSPATANTQHYEVPAGFFQRVLGPRLSYSCCYWPPGVSTLAQAEAAMLELTWERAEMADGQRVLDLGCGWGSWALWVAERCPHGEVVAVSNSAEQRRYIERARLRRGLQNLVVVTADMNTFEPAGRFDRVVSIEMFEHMRNHERLLARIGSWLRPAGKLFVHLFCHRRFGYFFEDGDTTDWMARTFFTGGMMPSVDLLSGFRDDLRVEAQWAVSGREYQRTLQAWLDRLDANRAEIDHVLNGARGTGGHRQAARWRLFLLACGELFGYGNGNEWLVSHYRLSRVGPPDPEGGGRPPFRDLRPGGFQRATVPSPVRARAAT